MSDDSTGLPELWDAERLAGYLGVTKHYVYRLTSEHRIRFVRVGKCLRFRPEDVAVWLDSQAVEVVSVSAVKARRGRPRSRDLAA
ncbi:MAG: helix-turn-helix domain-containing protein [Actinomycetota bacterium]|jgi:excisionase family DNA binding protein|nr:helix-turn-helix domain-containing protein [Actinomycetota bacterium]